MGYAYAMGSRWNILSLRSIFAMIKGFRNRLIITTRLSRLEPHNMRYDSHVDSKHGDSCTDRTSCLRSRAVLCTSYMSKSANKANSTYLGFHELSHPLFELEISL